MLLQIARQMKHNMELDGDLSADDPRPPHTHHLHHLHNEPSEEEGDILELSNMMPPLHHLKVLFHLFFKHVTPFLPVIHRPTFEATYTAKVQGIRGAVLVLLVCANGALHCDDGTLDDIVSNSFGEEDSEVSDNYHIDKAQLMS